LILELPWYFTATTVEPSGRAEVVSVAIPLFSCTVPSVVWPVTKVTGPVGVIVADDVLALKVTSWPTDDGFGAAVNFARVVAGAMVWVTTAEVLLRELESPRYVAVRGNSPAFRFVLVKVAMPLVLSPAEPTLEPDLKNFTIPVGGAPPLLITVAVKVTLSPEMLGLALELSETEVGILVVDLTTWFTAELWLEPNLESRPH
jgi:hypothetical protein